jgi:hypothetical protein
MCDTGTQTSFSQTDKLVEQNVQQNVEIKN